MADNAESNGWYIWSSHGIILFHIVLNPGCTVPDIADSLCLTQRTVWGAIGNLRRAGMLNIERRGRRHYYTVNMDALFRAPMIKGVTLGTLFGRLQEANGAAKAKQTAA